MCPNTFHSASGASSSKAVSDQQTGLIDWSTALRAALARDHPHSVSTLKTSRAASTRHWHGGDTFEVVHGWNSKLVKGIVLAHDGVFVEQIASRQR